MDFKFSLANCKRTSTEIPAQTNDHFYNMRKCCYVSVWINLLVKFSLREHVFNPVRTGN